MTELSTEIAVLAPGEKTLDELAEIANGEHAAIGKAFTAAMTSAIRCGEALLEARERVGGEGWRDWAEASLRFSLTSASHYMRLAAYKDDLPDVVFQPWQGKLGEWREPTLTRALPYLKGLPSLFTRGRPAGLSEEIRAEARRLRNKGRTYREISELLGICEASANRICDPEVHAQHRRNNKRLAKQKRAARQALMVQQLRTDRDRSAQRAGGALAETYSLIRRALQRADESAMATGDPEVRAALRETTAKLHQAEDAIAKALKVPST